MKILHLDIETSPNIAHVWGLFKQNVSLNQLMDSSHTLCWAAKWHGQRKVIFNSVHQSKSRDMLLHIWSLLDTADAVVHYNGSRFDIPTLNKEFLLLGLDPPTPYHQIDLLKVARQRFRFPSNKLDYVAQTLGLGKKTKHVGHELWVQCMAGADKAWRTMERYNKQDVKLLEKVYKKLLPWITNHPNHALFSDTTRPTCSNCGGTRVIRKGLETTKQGIYQRYRCTKCGTPLRGRFSSISREKKESIITQSK